MKAKNKKVRGMSLVEIIISMVVFAVSALLLVQVGDAINNMTKKANHVNKKVNIEAPLVSSGDDIVAAEVLTNADKTKSKEKLTVKNGYMESSKDNLKVTFEKEFGGHQVNLAGKSFTVKKAAEGNDFAKTDTDLQYVYVSRNLMYGSNVFVDPEEEESGESNGTDGKGDSGSKPDSGTAGE
jgi:Tfp pilus assembly protein PilV